MLESQLRALLTHDEAPLIDTILSILNAWSRTAFGTAAGRGIPQGNNVSAFLANLYLLPLDTVLQAFARKRKAEWQRYVDDVHVYTNTEADAREAVFVINRALRSLHLTLQGSKTEILTGNALRKESANSKGQTVDRAIKKLQALGTSRDDYAKQVTATLAAIRPIATPFRRGLPASVVDLAGVESRLFRRLLTAYGAANRPYLIKPAMAALEQLPDLRILQKTLRYITQLPYRYHDVTSDQLLRLVEDEKLPFPFQVASVLRSLRSMHPTTLNELPVRIRRIMRRRKRHWEVQQAGLEALAGYKCTSARANTIAGRYLEATDSPVKRAAFLLVPLTDKHLVRQRVQQLMYDPDNRVSLLAQFFSRLLSDRDYAISRLAGTRKGNINDVSLSGHLSALYVSSATEDPEIAKAVVQCLSVFRQTRSLRLSWHLQQLEARVSWVRDS